MLQLLPDEQLRLGRFGEALWLVLYLLILLQQEHKDSLETTWYVYLLMPLCPKPTNC